MRWIKSKVGVWWSNQDSHILDLLRGATKAGGLKIVSGFLSLGLSVVLARVLGPELAGAYFVALTVATVAATVGRLGLDSAVVRVVAGHVSAERWGHARMTHRAVMGIGLAGSVVIAAVIFAAADVMGRSLFSDSTLTTPLRIMAIAVIPLSLGVLMSRSLLGLSRIRDALMVFSILPYGIALAGTWFFAAEWGLIGAIVAYIFAVTAALAYGWFAWTRALIGRISMDNARGAASPARELLKSGTPLLIGAILQLVMTMSGMLMLGILANKTEVSLYAVAWRTAFVITFVLLAVNTIAQPKFAELYAKRDMQALAVTANKATLLMTIFAAPIFLTIVAAPKHVMGIFGSGFTEGALTLQILAIGQFINVATGSVGILLLMSGFEREYRNVQIVVAATILVLNLLLIPSRGAVGAAIAAAAALILQNVLFAYFVRARLGILTISVPKRRL